MSRFLKFFGKYITYVGFLIGIAGIVYFNVVLFVVGLGLVTFGCLTHEYSE